MPTYILYLVLLNPACMAHPSFWKKIQLCSHCPPESFYLLYRFVYLQVQGLNPGLENTQSRSRVLRRCPVCGFSYVCWNILDQCGTWQIELSSYGSTCLSWSKLVFGKQRARRTRQWPFLLIDVCMYFRSSRSLACHRGPVSIFRSL